MNPMSKFNEFRIKTAYNDATVIRHGSMKTYKVLPIESDHGALLIDGKSQYFVIRKSNSRISCLSGSQNIMP